jgi:DNA-nicking Smr family endonuclease
MTVDLHGMTVNEAKKYLIQKIKSVPKKTTEIEVIHGFHGGSALLQMVRTFKHPRVQRKILSLNQGATVFILTEND